MSSAEPHETPRDSLIGIPESAYGPEYKPHLLELYKLYVEMADHISDRREKANSFFLTINTALESARHRTNADRARQTELELASLGPFIELMKDPDKEEIRKSLIPTYFGRPVDAHEIKTVLDVRPKQ